MVTRASRPWRDVLLPWLTCAAMLAAILMIFALVANERDQGIVQRIFYFHVNLAWLSFAGFAVVAVASAIFLKTGSRKADRFALASAEVGILYTTLVLITGTLWAKPIWGVWWTWDPRLTMTLVLWTIYAAYLMLRRLGGEDEAVLRYAAVLGIVGSLDIPLLIVAVRLWRGVHPAVMINEDPDSGIKDPMMVWTLLVAMLALGFLFWWLVSLRERYARIDERLGMLHAEGAGA